MNLPTPNHFHSPDLSNRTFVTSHISPLTSQRFSLTSRVKPLERVVPGEDCTVPLAAAGLLALLGVDAVQLGGLVGNEKAHVQVRGAALVGGQGGDADLAQQVDAVGGLGDAHRLEVGAAEARELAVGEVLHRGEVLGLVLCVVLFARLVLSI